jgi:hypothetical protein
MTVTTMSHIFVKKHNKSGRAEEVEASSSLAEAY